MSPFSPSFDNAPVHCGCISVRARLGPGFNLLLAIELVLNRALAPLTQKHVHMRTTRDSEAKKMKHVQKAMKMFAKWMEQ